MGDRTTDPKTQRTVSKRVRWRREELRISQNELSRRIGLDHTAIAHIEGGRRLPSIAKLVALARALDTTTDYLCGLSAQHKSADSK